MKAIPSSSKEMASLLLFSLILLSLSSLSSPLPTKALLNAADVLCNSGYLSMALTLQIASTTLVPQSSSSLTIFSPSDSAFTQYGQPPLSLLQFHVSPLSFSLQSLKSLPVGSKIPTLLQDQSLIVTTSPSDVETSLNGVKVDGSPIYDDGSLIIFGVPSFFEPIFMGSEPVQSPAPSLNLGCVGKMNSTSSFSDGHSFGEACEVMRLDGYSLMASFLDLQLRAFREQSVFTVFAPVDESMRSIVGNYSDYASIFLRHVVPCKLLWDDLGRMENGTVLSTYLEGFEVNITRSQNIVMVNEVPVDFPGMYSSDWLAVHGLHQMLPLLERAKGLESPNEAPALSDYDESL